MGHIPSSTAVGRAVDEASETGVVVLANMGLADIPQAGEKTKRPEFTYK